jgi:catechol 2,3-dioxygenase-like lactoylglutathione lyase family enzyme
MVLTLSAQARDMYALMEYAPLPALMHEGRMWCALADSTRRSNYVAGDYRLYVHDFKTQRDSLVQDAELVDTINCLAQNSRWIFAAGFGGVSAFDKATRSWHRMRRFDSLRIWDIEATDSFVWLATDRRGVVRSNLTDSSVLRVTTRQGLASNSIFSLYLDGDTLFAGPFRNGRGGYPERTQDWYGLGLDAINVRTREVRHASLPDVADPYNVSKKWLVTDIYPAPGKPGRLRYVLWYPWDDWCWDRGEPGAVLMDAGQARAVADGVLARCGGDIDTVLRYRILKYLARTEFNTPGMQQIVSELAEGHPGERRFPQYTYQAVAAADYERMRQFYTATLGFTKYRDPGRDACSLVLDGQLLLYLDGTYPKVPPVYWGPKPRFLVPASTAALLYRRLRAAGSEVTRSVPADTLSYLRGFEFKDPTGNRVVVIGVTDRYR